jgi:LacI family transcriptional regulator
MRTPRKSKLGKHAITIDDVAADSSVSIATVSRVLNEPWRVLPETKDRVTASINKLGYVPNIRARLLARGQSGIICFLLSNRPFAHSVHSLVLKGAAARADIMGLQVIYATCNYQSDTPADDIALPSVLAANGLIDGVVVAGTNYPNILTALDELDLPYVMYGTNMVVPSDDFLPKAVYIDGEHGGYLATRYLLSLGHTKIRYIGEIAMPWYGRRYTGYCRAMQEAGLPCPPAVGSSAEGEMAMGFNTTSELLDAGDEFTALFVGGDAGALGALRAMRRRGIAVPRDVSLVGFNDEELARIADPPLTTVRGANEEAGMQCVEMLNALIRRTVETAEPVIVPVSLIERESAAAPRMPS